MKIKEITSYLESFAPVLLQEDYDNAGLIVGNPETDVTGILVTIDSTEVIIDEATRIGANLIIAHHPIVLSGLKKINGKSYIERTIIKAIKNDIAIYAIHTNIDSILGGVNSKIAEKLTLQNTKILETKSNHLLKLVYFVPSEHAENTRNAIFVAGAGQIGNYDMCSFNVEGKGSFRAGEGTDPFVGKKGELHFENEIRVEVILPKHLVNNVVKSLMESHPYEEVAYDIYVLKNDFEGVGSGIIGELKTEMSEMDFLNLLKSTFNAQGIRYTKLLNKPIKKVAICGGSGSFLLNKAIGKNADVFVSSDFKYHQFFDAENKILIADIGHFESEQFTKELIYELLIKKFPKFAIHFTEVNTNPINYL
ncbi:MAG: Nif3-like dinuclear metal center hexameric protein [Bacteroidetes bacterium GWF2_33_16]|nr:MAG: Nif3-like dinuclear metal center hexameric protein [Bacteroidetes bacterium GWE2_32_14]OFY07832.1 MAG: Nif3-like dinuclear metal center hexameric protein [Bacteroidetes bacterium GWF2_33_16]